MRAGVPVTGAAAEIVQGTRDGEPDIAVSVRGRANLQGKDAGNGVFLDHGDGWTTQYSHMRQGSVQVKTGRRVERGQTLGLIGESGNADFPRLDFQVRYEGKIVDPFSPYASEKCGVSEKALWSAEALSALNYQPTGILIAGCSGESLTREKAEAGAYS